MVLQNYKIDVILRIYYFFNTIIFTNYNNVDGFDINY